MNNLSEEKKEYEELKSLLYIGIILQYGKRKLIDLIEKQFKEIERLKNKCKELIFEKHELTLALLDSIPKDKIKAKIEYYEKIDNPVGKRVLQSLLEKE